MEDGRTVRIAAPLGPGAPAVLLVYHRHGAEVVPLRPGQPVVLGRGEAADVTVRDDSLSRLHARFTLGENGLLVEDLGSTNGTFVGSRRVEDAVVQAGDAVTVGAVTVALQRTDGGAAAGLEGHERLRGRVADELDRARCFHRAFSLVMVRAPRHLSGWVATARTALRPVDRAALYGPAVLEVLLPETGAEDAAKLAREVVAGIPGARAGVATFPEAGTSVEELVAAALDALDRAARGGAPVAAAGSAEPSSELGEPVFTSPPMRALLTTIQKVSSSSISVLLLGETGSGKEVVARAIHERSPRRGRRMVAVNCGAIAPTLLESTLFGFEKGAFTGAMRQTKGVFEEGDGSTVFLDEIGELPLAAQAALLRVLEARRVTRVGSTEEIPVDVRIVAATHVDLEERARDGRFRADLLYRLNPITLTVPPLRERRADIPPLVERFVAGASAAHGRSVRHVDPDVLALLQGYDWPGNVRELRNLVDRAVVLAEDDTITLADLPDRVRARVPAPTEGPAAPSLEPGIDFNTRVQRFETALLLDGLRAAAWNQTRASEILGIPRRTLINKMQAYGIRRGGYAVEGDE